MGSRVWPCGVTWRHVEGLLYITRDQMWAKPRPTFEPGGEVPSGLLDVCSMFARSCKRGYYWQSSRLTGGSLHGNSTPPLRLPVGEGGCKVKAHVPRAQRVQRLKRRGRGPRSCNTESGRGVWQARQTNQQTNFPRKTTATTTTTTTSATTWQALGFHFEFFSSQCLNSVSDVSTPTVIGLLSAFTDCMSRVLSLLSNLSAVSDTRCRGCCVRSLHRTQIHTVVV